MALAWNGADPSEVGDGNDYELGVWYRAEVDITISHLRVWTGAGEINVTNRRGRIWSSAGATLALITMPDNPGTGWTLHALDTPLAINAGQVFLPAYMTGGNYGALAGALAGNVPSADGNVTALASASTPNGFNGTFNTDPGTFPDTGFGSPFYGVDFQYTLGHGANTAPRITDTSAVADGLQVTASALVEDDESLTDLQLRIEWGDGNASTVTYPTLSASHTYATGGVFPLLFRATDDQGATDFAADYVITTAPDPTVFTLDLPGLQAELCSVVMRLGHFDTCEAYEPREAPNTALHAAFWLLSVRPARAASGLASASTIVTYTGRIYIPAGDGTTLPYEEIDQRMFAAADRLMAAFCAKFTLGGRVRNVDIFGAHSPGLGLDTGYAAFGGATGKKFRIATITLPLIVNDMYPEVP